MTISSPLGEISSLEEFHALSGQLTRFLMEYKFGIDEVTTKISILQEEFAHLHDYNPIEHVLSRVKSPESIFDKMQRRGVPSTLEDIREQITDIAGVRVTCSFTSDVYRVFDLLSGQPDLKVVQVEDYIVDPKPNGYRSLHALVEIPVHLSDRVVQVTVELQIRTVAMDFWASLEHKIYYKYRTAVPTELLRELKDAAETAASLDAQMERLHGAAKDQA
ncbi:putative GTP pyrophosphokinase [Nocardioides daedukensis]|uniref:Putative GTP pyrophosphokinase n=1 Tax=Nocardioides daedukensis TaxID=634462 RepID=A0A7Y9S363_9ACTN|nr:putative GTP pyrophosphokinase [Nocardioides daedukensis]